MRSLVKVNGPSPTPHPSLQHVYQGGGALHEISKLHILANACYQADDDLSRGRHTSRASEKKKKGGVVMRFLPPLLSWNVQST